MGYTTDFHGTVSIDPPLNEHEVEFLRDFAQTRRMTRAAGPYYVGGDDDRNSGDIYDFNRPPDGQPGLWCQWVPDLTGQFLEWDGGEKFYHAAEWMKYLIDHFIKPGAEAQELIKGLPDKVQVQFAYFTFDHVVNGTIEAQGEDADDRWALIVKDNVVYTADATFVYNDPQEL